MLHTEITLDDVAFIINAILLFIMTYVGWRIGYNDGFHEGSKARRLIMRDMRRGNQKRLSRIGYSQNRRRARQIKR